MAKLEPIFDSLYRRLNEAQREAVDTIEGPVMVIAGPGTGKTQVLTLRIANILRQTDIGPDGILALTFTQSGVHAMRERLARITGGAAYRVHIHTFHGFANDIIRRYPEYFSRIIGGQNADPIDQFRIIEEIILSKRLAVLRPFGNPRYYCAPVKDAIDRLKRENLSPSDLARVVRERSVVLKREGSRLSAGERTKKERSLLKLKELTLVYRAYEEALRKEHLYDYGDMVMELIRELEANPDLLLTLREEYQYILADEHQDANQSQNRILELLAGEDADPNLFIVGDDRQAIYQFQGASLDNFLYFSKRFPRARIIELLENYRSTQSVLDALYSLAPVHPNGNERPELTSFARGAGELVRIAALTTEDNEAPFVASCIADDIKEGIVSEEIAVLYRENRDMQRIADALSVAGMPFVVESNASILNDPRVRAFIALLRGIVQQGDERSASELLLLPWLTIPLLSRVLVLEHARKEKVPLMKALSMAANIGGIEQGEALLLKEYAAALSRWHGYARKLLLPEAVQIILKECGATPFFLSEPDSAVLMERMAGLYELLKTFTERHPHAYLEEFIEYLALHEAHHLSIPALQSVSRPGVRLMTAHASKGLEFDSVYLVGAVDGRFGNRRSREVFDLPIRGTGSELSGIDDERRLFYVALSRARTRVLVSFARTRAGKAQMPAQFINEIRRDRVVYIDTSSFEQQRAPESLLLASPRLSPLPVSHQDYVRHLFLSREFSVTHLNNYLRCPWHYFFVNLLRIPEAKSPSQSYGTAVHAALRVYGEQLTRGIRPSLASLLKSFDEALAREPLTGMLATHAKEKGHAALSGYYKERAKTLTGEAKVEWRVSGPSLTLSDGGTLVLGGTLDRLEYHGDMLVVRDFKTRAPLSRNELMGVTASSDGSYYRQLLFYKILVDGANLGTPLSQGIIDFIEPNDRGIYKYEVFDLASGEVEKLISEIVRVANEISSLSFWGRRCDEPDCEYCALRAAMEHPELARVSEVKRYQHSGKQRKRKSHKQVGKRPYKQKE